VSVEIAGSDAGPTVREVIQAFLDAMRGEMANSTREWYTVFLNDFGDRHPSLPAGDITEDLDRKWMSAARKCEWGRSTRRHAIANLKRALNWAVDARMIADNPIARMRRPKTVARERIMTPEERDRLLASYPESDPFRDLLVALQESGCRPGEAMKVTAADVDLEEGTWRMRGKDYATTGKMRVIYLTPTLLELTRRLMREHASGPLFRNADGNPWTRHAVSNRLRRKKRRKKDPIGGDIVADTHRATWATEALTNEVPVATMAQLMGHADTTMVSRHYAKLAEKKDYLRQAAVRAVTGSPATVSSRPPADAAVPPGSTPAQPPGS
jgi:integrase